MSPVDAAFRYVQTQQRSRAQLREGNAFLAGMVPGAVLGFAVAMILVLRHGGYPFA